MDDTTFKSLLKHRYVQNEHNKDLPKDAGQGVCFGLCVLWANRLRKQPSEAPESRVKMITGPQQRPSAIRIQQKWNKNNSEDAERRLWDEFAFRLQRYENYLVNLANKKQATDKIAKVLIDAERNLKFTALGWYKAKGGGGHQMVSWSDKDTLFFYDPNGGEFHVPKKQALDFFAYYWGELRDKHKDKVAEIGKVQYARLLTDAEQTKVLDRNAP